MTSRRRLIRFVAVSIAGCICVSLAIQLCNDSDATAFSKDQSVGRSGAKWLVRDDH